MQFTGFYGNELVRGRISVQADSGKIPHAIILEGAKGLGKKTLAQMIAAACVCSAEGETPCGVCGDCVRAKSGNHADIITVSGSGKTGAIPVDEIRKVKEDAYLAPTQAHRKVYILTDADKTLPAAQNAFLKCFEEPPAKTVFIITCSSSLSLLETIRSRAVTYRMEEVSKEDALKAVSDKLGDEVDTQRIEIAHKIWGGNIGRIIESLSDEKFSKQVQISEDIANAILSSKEFDIVKSAAPLERDRDALTAVLGFLSLIFRDALVIKSKGGNLISVNTAAAEKLGKRLKGEQLISLYELAQKLIADNRRNVSMPLMTAKMCAAMRKIVQ